MKKIFYYTIVTKTICSNGSERFGATAETEMWMEESSNKIQVSVKGSSIENAEAKMKKLMNSGELIESHEVKREFYLCSKEVVKRMKLKVVSNPVMWENEEVFIALINFEELEKYHDQVIQAEEEAAGKLIDFWANECVPGFIDVKKITMRSIKKNGLFQSLFYHTNFTNPKNLAMAIRNISDREGINVFELFNKISN